MKRETWGSRAYYVASNSISMLQLFVMRMLTSWYVA